MNKLSLCLLFLFLTSVAPCDAEAQTEERATARANKELIRRLYDEVFIKWNLALVDDIVSADFVGHGMPPGTPRGPVGFRQFYGMLRTAFPDLRYTVEDLVAEEDRVVVRWRWEATHGGTFLNIPPTGKPAPMTGIAIYRLTGGKIVERWVELDLLGLGRRLGAMLALPKS